jgi:hypothetical protein
MVALAMLAGRSLSGRGPIWARLLTGTIGLALVPLVLTTARTPQEAWAATLFTSLYVTLSLACAVPMRAAAPPEHRVVSEPTQSWSARSVA